MDGKRKKPELLMPAGNLDILKTAVVYGADAVYLGGETLSLRAGAKNFSMPEIREGVAFAHAHGAKVYVAANIFAHNADLRPALKFFLLLKNIQPDALILSDPGLFSMAQEVCPEIPVHISTQAYNT
ncbi:MAG: U32 family peptidase, partial [Lachnospiraceae bacterium]|nr:U32 family peptidase [Lachnospiraceae bacterium]